jgi:hypothetical protein
MTDLRQVAAAFWKIAWHAKVHRSYQWHAVRHIPNSLPFSEN